MGPPLRSAVGVVVGEWRTAQSHPGDRPGVQNGPEIHGAHPCPRAHCPSRMSPQVVVHPVCHA